MQANKEKEWDRARAVQRNTERNGKEGDVEATESKAKQSEAKRARTGKRKGRREGENKRGGRWNEEAMQ